MAERILFDLYRNRNDQECFGQLCGLFGRKYDLIAYLYFILDPSSYLPLRSSIFDGIFKKLQINLQTAGRCSWENYQDFLSTIASVRDIMQEYYQISDVELLDAHSFLWTLNLDVLNMNQPGKIDETEAEVKKIEVGVTVSHKDYGIGVITRLTEEKVYIDFNGKPRIFPYPEVFKKGYLCD